MAQMVAAVETLSDGFDELRAAVSELAASELRQRRRAVEDLRESARKKFSDLEMAAHNSLARLIGNE